MKGWGGGSNINININAKVLIKTDIPFNTIIVGILNWAASWCCLLEVLGALPLLVNIIFLGTGCMKCEQEITAHCINKRLKFKGEIKIKKKLRGFGPLANYADRPSDRRFLAK
jgi:hypothetical protein